MSILKTNELKKQYGAGANLVKALDGVVLNVEPGEFVAIVGTSGSGKSTLLHMRVFIDEFNNEWSERKNVNLDELHFQYSHLSERIFPQLIEQGITQKQIEQMVIQNPQNYFEKA